jgi:predicted DCC family thiol-disulfide oxidoreductase YuxK
VEAAPTRAVLFYDGGCGLCHLSVRALLALDRRGRLLFAPLEGGTFRELVPEAERAARPDSLVLRTADGRLLVRSAAVLESLRLLGGPARWLAAAARVVPRPLADRLYDRVARARRRLFRPPSAACPAVAPALRARFLP